MATVRNPLSAFIVTILGALGLSIVSAIPTLFIPVLLGPSFELQLIVLSFVLVGVGAVAGRSSIIGSMGFIGAFVGGFGGILLFQMIPGLWATAGWEFMLALYLGALCGVGGLLTGKLGLKRVEKIVSAMPQTRRCQRCGAKVGISARKCWSCRAFLPQN
jgi:ribosomal protein L40E